MVLMGSKPWIPTQANLPHSVSKTIISVISSPNPSLPLLFFWLQNERMCKGERLGLHTNEERAKGLSEEDHGYPSFREMVLRPRCQGA